MTPREIEDHFEEAALTLRRLPNPSASGPRNYGRSWPEYVHEAKHAYGYQPARMRVISNAREIQRMEEALDWLALIGGETEQTAADNRRVVWMRAEGHRWTTSLLTVSKTLKKCNKTLAHSGTTKSTGAEPGAKPRGGAP